MDIPRHDLGVLGVQDLLQAGGAELGHNIALGGLGGKTADTTGIAFPGGHYPGGRCWEVRPMYSEHTGVVF